jgi:hypothetical protein
LCEHGWIVEPTGLQDPLEHLVTLRRQVPSRKKTAEGAGWHTYGPSNVSYGTPGQLADGRQLACEVLAGDDLSGMRCVVQAEECSDTGGSG